ncbi:MAG TPA: acyl carrier protein [Chloroflexota bacterium]|nr:acyl carrier protein [Chloroflexota bacterium]
MNTAQKLKHYIATEIMYADDDALSEDEPLLGSGIIDSLGIMRLVSYIEEEFGVEVPEDQLVPEHFRTVTALAQFVERLQHRA